MFNSKNKTLKVAEDAMEHAASYQEWSEAAKRHDSLSGMDEWKAREQSRDYDFELVKLRLQEYRRLRKEGQIEKLVWALREGLHGNLGNISNPALYNHAQFGTKHLVNEYLDEVVTSLNYVCDTEFPNFDAHDKVNFFKRTFQGFGRSALMLSGGAVLGLFHLGVIKALWDNRLLPNIISGSSAGSIVASVVGTHTDAELSNIFDPDYLYLEAFRLLGLRRVLNGETLMDGEQLELCLERNVPDLTFEEAFNRSGRLINTTVSPTDPHQLSRLLNALTSPHVLVRRACLASCSIPGVFPPVMLWAKNIQGEIVPYIANRKWVDGSIKDDLPATRLARLYSVNHFIVSQTNPHVVPFLSRRNRTRGFIKFGREFIDFNLRNNLTHVMNFVRDYVYHEELGLILDKATSIVAQKYVGDINIVPPRNPRNFFRMLANPTGRDVEWYIRTGERTTWPKLELIRNTTRISTTLMACMDRLPGREAITWHDTSPAPLRTLKVG